MKSVLVGLASLVITGSAFGHSKSTSVPMDAKNFAVVAVQYMNGRKVIKTTHGPCNFIDGAVICSFDEVTKDTKTLRILVSFDSRSTDESFDEGRTGNEKITSVTFDVVHKGGPKVTKAKLSSFVQTFKNAKYRTECDGITSEDSQGSRNCREVYEGIVTYQERFLRVSIGH